MNAWLTDPKTGKRSVSLTLMVVAFALTSLAYVASMVEAAGPLTFRPFDAGAVASFLVPMVGLYFGRKFSAGKHGEDVEKETLNG